jgi:hypothetical protein
MLVKIISSMLKNTYTTDDLIERLGHMRTYYGVKIFSENSNKTLDEVLRTQCEPHTLKRLKEWERAFEADNIQPLVVYEALDTVQEEVVGMPTVTLYVPARFSPEDVERFGAWFRSNVQPNILLTLRVDPRSTGGCSMIWKHTYYDFSLHYYIQKNRDAVVKVVNEHIHA